MPTITGLSSVEAMARLTRFGHNITTDVPRPALWLQFIGRFKNPLIILLMVASFLAALSGDTLSFAIIMMMISLSITLDFVQETRAEKAVDALRQSVALTATVIRDGTEQNIPVQEIAQGDVVKLIAGTLVAADGTLIEGEDLYVNQALITGESYPSEKNVGQDTELFMGSSVMSGTGLMEVTATGKRSKLGGLAGALLLQRPPTAFQIGMTHFGMLILRVAMVMVLLVLLINIAFHRPLLEAFMFSLALAVGLTPELLPMLMTINLSRGAVRMAKARVIVKHLPSMHNLGAMDVLCTDKTGTLTEARIKLAKSVDALGQENKHPFTLAYINSMFETGVKSPLDDALQNEPQPDIRAYEKIDEVPFDFERRRVSVLTAHADKHLLIVKGAPEDILALSTTYDDTATGTTLPFSEATKKESQAVFDSLGEQGLRALGVAYRYVDTSISKANMAQESHLTFAGYVAFIDPPKKSAGEALKRLQRDGIAVRIITGDNEHVTRHVCTLLGFNMGEVMTGDQLNDLSVEAFYAKLKTTHVFCRVTPQQKSRIIAALKATGHTVGYMGDGINDAPALHQADVGLSVDTATDVARAAADMILLDKDLSVIHAGILEGRRAVENTEKYIFMSSSSNFGNIASMAIASIFLPFLPMLPIQILLNNLLYDASQATLSFDKVDPESLCQPTKWDMARIWKFMWILGPLSSLFDILTFYVLLTIFHANQALFQTGWFVESLVTQVLIVLSIRTHKSMFKSRPHRFVSMAALGIAGVAIAFPFTPVGAWFGLVPLPLGFFGFLAVTVLLYFALVETVKRYISPPHVRSERVARI